MIALFYTGAIVWRALAIAGTILVMPVGGTPLAYEARSAANAASCSGGMGEVYSKRRRESPDSFRRPVLPSTVQPA